MEGKSSGPNVPHAAERQNIQFPTEMEQLAIWYRMPTRQNRKQHLLRNTRLLRQGVAIIGQRMHIQGTYVAL